MKSKMKGDTKKVIEEGGQLGGSLIGGAAGGAIGGLVGSGAMLAVTAVFGVATGGVGLVIVGLFTAGGAYYGGEALKAGVKAITDEINSGGSK